MSMSVGASSSSALSYLQSLLQQGAAKDTKKASASDPLSVLMQAISGEAGSSEQTDAAAPPPKSGACAICPPFSTDTMSALLSAQGQQPANGPSAKLFAKLDADDDGQISKAEFADAASKAGADSDVADAVFAKIDGDGDGAISQSELTKADRGGHRHPQIGGGQGPLDELMSASGVNGATTQTTTNADGSTTTTISYADGSKIDMTTPAEVSTAGTGNKNTANLLEQLIKLQAQVLNLATSTMSAVA